MSKPMVAVTADCREFEIYHWHCVPQPYIDALADVAEIMPVIVPALGDRADIETVLDRVDGVLVTGAKSNVHPKNYGEEPTPAHEPFDPARDATTLPLIRAAIERGVPLLAICRGIQELNVAMGGSITAAFQEARNVPEHSYPDDGKNDVRFAISHGVKVADNSCIADVLEVDNKQEVRVNSLHRQALNRLGERVVVEAVADDGTVEAVSIADAPGFVIGVQWHPEYWAQTDTPSNRIFKAFGAATRQYAAGKTGVAVAAE